jgi:hypothetical protein
MKPTASTTGAAMTFAQPIMVSTFFEATLAWMDLEVVAMRLAGYQQPESWLEE